MTTPDGDWLAVLRQHRTEHGNGPTGQRIGYSSAVVSQVLNGKYIGDMNAVQKAVEGALMGLTVDCPIIGDLPRHVCLDYQRRGFAATNHLRAQFARSCPTCPHRRGGDGESQP